MKSILKIPLIVVGSLLFLYVIFVAYIKLNNPNPLYMDYRYSRVIVQPLAKMGCANAQFKMGSFWFYGSGTDPNMAELENAVYWWEKASAKGHEDAIQELAIAKQMLDDPESCGSQSNQNNISQTEETDSILLIQESTIIEPRLEEDFENIPEIFNGLNNPRVFITYNQLINGYRVNLMWFPWKGTGEVGHAILEFIHTSGNRFYIHNPYYSDDYFYSQTEREFRNGEVYRLDYSPPSRDEQLGHNTPFQFLDADFDGELELCINNWRCGHRDYNTYDVYKIRPHHAEKLTRKPYDYLDDGNEFDFKNKTITQIWSDGWDHTTRLIYGYHEMPKNQTDEKALFDDFYYPIKLDSLYLFREGNMFIYERQRDSLILVDTYPFE